ncbi:hypothetical protein KQX54_021234 [Cotesia glomerata]|uniref:Uncharacterized protein n=1 Tax=Cotesia glomerata TaxID=32391 RepID=A0AAV7IVI9_COTGL|nr:hypothetical protein KQX54_021234 [Cotesia glomerata]
METEAYINYVWKKINAKWVTKKMCLLTLHRAKRQEYSEVEELERGSERSSIKRKEEDGLDREGEQSLYGLGWLRKRDKDTDGWDDVGG